MTNCPTCNREVDTLRARDVGVRDGKVIAYCSPECLSAASSQPTVMPSPPAASAIPGRTPVSGVAAAVPPFDSGPVIEIIREPASGVVTSARDTRVVSEPVIPKRVESDTHDLRALQARAATEDVVPPRSRAPLIAIIVMLLIAAAGVLAYRFLYTHRAAAATQVAPPRPVAIPEPPKPAPPVEPPAITAEAAVARARTVLHAQLASESPRVARVAAAALARTGDDDAIATLAAALGHEASDSAKLDIAYALARGGDKRGIDNLVAALGSTRRDVRAESARRLALLGDAKAIPVLAEYLEVSQLRLGAAEQLAYLAEPRAIKALEQVRADANASANDKARATIALGIAGRSDVVPALHELLGDTRFNSFAAATLAPLHDSAARPLLIKHLEIPSLRVGAARALRALEPELDPRPLLRPLVEALASDKDTELVSVSETILLLAGPASWSAHE